jgi:hypothetical protein
MTDLPKYPGAAGHAAALQLAAARQELRDQIVAVEAELARTDETFGEAFARLDSRTATKDRIRSLAATNPRHDVR